MTEIAPITGRRRQRQTRWTVKLIDRLARRLIIVGGIGTIAAVLSVCVFLFWVAAPLMFSPQVDGRKALAQADAKEPPVHVALDEFRTMAWTLSRDGRVRVMRLDNGELLSEQPLSEPTPLSAWSLMSGDGSVAFGYADGTVRLGNIRFATRFLAPKDLPANHPADSKELFAFDGGLAKKTGDDQWRSVKLAIQLEDPIPAASPAPIVLLDHVVRSKKTVVATVSGDGKMRHLTVSKKKGAAGAPAERQVATQDITFEAPATGLPRSLVLSGLADQLYVAWNDGEMLRFDARKADKIRLAEKIDLLADPAAKITALAPLLGRSTLIVGDSQGGVQAWFGSKPAGAETIDGIFFVRAHQLSSSGAAITSLGMSARSRLVVAGRADGEVDLLQVTSQRRLLELKTEGNETITAVAIAPKDNGLAALNRSGLSTWGLDLKHPEATLATLLLPVWYEGYAAPAFVWQSSSGTDDFEPKLSLIPLIFGTLKATSYSLLFGVPVALLAAVYASEFMTKRVRGRIKPAIELMAGLPSVVLGFLAALVLAPMVERWLPAVLASFGTIPLVLLLSAFLWQLLPERVALRLAPWRFVFILVVMPLGALLGVWSAPLLERWLFAGDLKLWLNDHQRGSAIGGWMILFMPLASILTAWLMGRLVSPWLRKASANWSRLRCGLADLARFAIGAAAAIGIAWVAAECFSLIGWDARGTFVDTYVQRNALVVGFVMGFAIIPLIYTIAEDALSSVPEHLRTASMGAGATPWQTATRVIIPTAMSGLFSAVMIGLGRAVGETMIVLMAAGNTPILETNIFNGFRTLSANLAVELPEAVRNSTHFRTLFLAALALFAMTFVINTIAEAVRQRFRKRAFQL